MEHKKTHLFAIFYAICDAVTTWYIHIATQMEILS